MTFELCDSLRELYPTLESFTNSYLSNLKSHRACAIQFLAALAQISTEDVENYPFCFQIAKQPKIEVCSIPPDIGWAPADWRNGSFNFCEKWLRDTNLPKHGGMCAAYITVNQTDGNGRSIENIVNVRAMFVELDHGGLNADHIVQFRDTFCPSILIESSPGKLHCYWLLQSESCPLEKFSFCQQLLQARFASLRAGTESKDLPRILRVPGFLHLKDFSRPFVVKLHHCDSNLVYTPDKVFSLVGIDKDFVKKVQSEIGVSSYIAKATAPGSGEYLGAPDGNRNEAFFNYCYEQLFQRRNLPFKDALTLACANNLKNVPPLSEEEVKGILNSAYKRHLKHSPKDPVSPEDIYEPPLATDVLTEWTEYDYNTPGMVCRISDESLADRIMQAYGSDINHSSVGGFYVYNGLIWANANGEGKQLVSKYMRELFRYVPDEEGVRAYFSTVKLHNAFRRDIHSAMRRRAAMELLAQRIEIATTLDQFNREEESDVIACPNGILDLSKGKIIASDPKYRLTHVMGTRFDPDATCETWDNFVSSCMGEDKQLIIYLQKITGYFLSGRTHLQSVFVVYGVPGTGKSVYLAVMSKLLGGYFKELHKNTLILNSGSENAKMSSLAQAIHCRLATIAETSSKDTWDESLVKQISGNDPVTAKMSHKDTVVFTPRFKVCIRANNLPSEDQYDEGLWSRLTFIPFEVRFRGTTKDDKFLIGKLSKELPGILNWAVKGYQMLMKDGLEIPEKARTQKNTAQCESEPIRAFVERCCVQCEEGEPGLPIDEFWNAFTVYCRTEGKTAPTGKVKRNYILKELGVFSGEPIYDSAKKKNVRQFNYRLKTASEKEKDEVEYTTSDNVRDIKSQV